MNLAKVNWNQRYIHKKVNKWICKVNQLSAVYFKITLAENELSITNNEVHGFLKVFEHSKNETILETDWPKTFSLTTWEPRFAEIRFLTEQLLCIT